MYNIPDKKNVFDENVIEYLNPAYKLVEFLLISILG